MSLACLLANTSNTASRSSSSASIRISSSRASPTLSLSLLSTTNINPTGKMVLLLICWCQETSIDANKHLIYRNNSEMKSSNSIALGQPSNRMNRSINNFYSKILLMRRWASWFTVVKIYTFTNFTLRILEIMSPQWPNLVLPTNIPNSEADVLIFNGFHVETCGKNIL